MVDLSVGDIIGGSKFGEGNLDDEGSSFEVLVVERSEGLLLISFVVELDEAKSLRSSGFLLDDVSGLVGEARILEDFSKSVVFEGERQVSNEESSG